MNKIIFITIFSILTFVTSSFAQVSKLLEEKNGYREIKLLTPIAKVQTSQSFNSADGNKIYVYSGPSKSLYHVFFKQIEIQTNDKGLITKIRIRFNPLDPEVFTSLSASLKKDFGVPSGGFALDNGSGANAWVTKSIYMDFVFFSDVPDFKIGLIMNIGFLNDLDEAIKKDYIGDSDGF